MHSHTSKTNKDSKVQAAFLKKVMATNVNNIKFVILALSLLLYISESKDHKQFRSQPCYPRRWQTCNHGPKPSVKETKPSKKKTVVQILNAVDRQNRDIFIKIKFKKPVQESPKGSLRSLQCEHLP